MLDGIIAIPEEMADRYGLTPGVEIDMVPTEKGLLIQRSERLPGEPVKCPYAIPRGGIIGPLRGHDPYVWGTTDPDDQEEDALRMLVHGQAAIPAELLDRYGLVCGDELECRPTENGLRVWKSEDQPDNPLDRAIGLIPRGGIIDQLGGIDGYISAIRGGGPRGL